MNKFMIILSVFYNISFSTFAQNTVITNPLNNYENKIECAENIKNTLEKLAQIKASGKGQLTILHLGDSHIQMDYFTRTIRENLQKEFGDMGDGILFPYSACKSVGPRNLKSKLIGKWDWNNVLNNPNTCQLGVCGYGLKTNDMFGGLTLKYRSYRDSNNIFTPNQITILHGNNNFKIRWKGKVYEPTVNQNFSFTTLDQTLADSNLSIDFEKTNEVQKQFEFRGIVFENTNASGIMYHHCGVVGAQWMHFLANAPLLEDEIKLLKPDLIIISFGSNESYNGNFNENTYFSEVTKFIQTIKSQNQGVEILLTTTPDTRSSGRFPVFTKAINQKLHQITNDNKLALWDLYEVMGGNASIYQWLNQGWAMKDKLHFTKPGYQLQGNLLTTAFINEYNKLNINKINIDSLSSSLSKQLENFKNPIIVSEVRKKTSTNANSKKYHTVKSGDTLSSLARKYSTSVEKLKKLNQLKNSNLKLGIKLRVK